MSRLMLLLAVMIPCFSVTVAGDENTQPQSTPTPTRIPRTFFVTRSLAHERLMPYLKAARPEVAQIGNYGAMFHGYADNPRSAKTPMMLPVVGERACLEFQRKLNADVHEIGLKVVGHFRLVKVMADWKEQTGFVEYYNKRWPEDLLGPKPHPNLLELLQRDASGQPIQLSRYDNAQLALCLSSPHARQMLKQMLKCAIDRGIDGVITTYNYHQSCACPHCQDAFRNWLQKKLGRRLGIKNLDGHKFDTIPAQIPGYPTEEAGDLEWLAMEWGAKHFKQMYDDIFINYGRKIRPGLLVAQWNHLSHISIKEERMFLPQPMWGKDEDYFWYSGGASFVRKNLNLKEGKAGDAWLSGLYVRELGGRRPFVLGKYDGIRLAASMAEGYALGGLGMGRYMRFEEPAGFDVLARYTNFMHKHRDLYVNAQPLSDAALVLPRQSVWSRHPAALDAFREVGQALVERQVLLDVLADEAITAERLKQYRALIFPGPIVLSKPQLQTINNFASNGGRLLFWNSAGALDEQLRKHDWSPFNTVVAVHESAKDAAGIMKGHVDQTGSRIEAPWTVRATAYRQPNRILVHLVNYNRDESVDKTLRGSELERPKPARNLGLEIRVPDGHAVKRVVVYSPEGSAVVELPFEVDGNRIKARLPKLLVYAVVSVETQPN